MTKINMAVRQPTYQRFMLDLIIFFGLFSVDLLTSLLVHLSTCSLVHLYTCSLVHLYNCPLVHLSTCLLVHLSTCSLVRSLVYFLLFQDKKKVDMKSGKTAGLSGKEMFMFNPSIINQATEDGDDEEGGDFDLNMREKDDDYGVKVGLTKRDCGFCHYYNDLFTYKDILKYINGVVYFL